MKGAYLMNDIFNENGAHGRSKGRLAHGFTGDGELEKDGRQIFKNQKNRRLRRH